MKCYSCKTWSALLDSPQRHTRDGPPQGTLRLLTVRSCWVTRLFRVNEGSWVSVWEPSLTVSVVGLRGAGQRSEELVCRHWLPANKSGSWRINTPVFLLLLGRFWALLHKASPRLSVGPSPGSHRGDLLIHALHCFLLSLFYFPIPSLAFLGSLPEKPLALKFLPQSANPDWENHLLFFST